MEFTATLPQLVRKAAQPAVLRQTMAFPYWVLIGFVLYLLIVSERQKQGAGRATLLLITVTEKKKTKKKPYAKRAVSMLHSSLPVFDSDAGPPSSAMSCNVPDFSF